MRTAVLATAAAVPAVLALVGCAGTTTQTHAAASPAATDSAPAAAAPMLSCAQLAPIITTLVKDQRNQDRTYQEKWIMGNQGGDLNAALDATDAATSSTASQLTTDAATFNADANAFLADNSPYLAPGWQDEYNTVKADIATLATDCGIPHRRL
jgi:hypothetical protein